MTPCSTQLCHTADWSAARLRIDITPRPSWVCELYKVHPPLGHNSLQIAVEREFNSAIFHLSILYSLSQELCSDRPTGIVVAHIIFFANNCFVNFCCSSFIHQGCVNLYRAQIILLKATCELRTVGRNAACLRFARNRVKPCPHWRLPSPNSATVAKFGGSRRFRRL